MESTLCPRPAFGPARSRQRGFTLVEILVVIGVVVLLMALLLPALSRARQSVNALKCASNLRQIGLAELQYMQENRGRMVPTNVKYGSNFYDWPGLLVGLGYLQAPPTSAGVINEDAMGSSVFGCPDGLSDQLAIVNGSLPSSGTDGQGARPQDTPVINLTGTKNYIDFWYGCNASSDSPWSPTGVYKDFPNWNVPPTNDVGNLNNWPRMSDVRWPTSTVDKMDGCAGVNLFNTWRMHARHYNNTSTNILFFDGHVRTVLFAGLPGPKPSIGTALWSATQLKSFTKEPDVLFLVDQVP